MNLGIEAMAVVSERPFWHYPAHCRPHRTEPS